MDSALLEQIEKLNEEQKQAVCSELKNLLIVAGAGTGKTTVLVSRIAYLVEHFNIAPFSILSVTFTNKAAKEMKSRLEVILGKNRIRYMWCCTFHSACLKILRNFAKYANLEPNFVVIDNADQLRIIKRVLEELGISATDKDNSPKNYLNIISKCKEEGIRPNSYNQQTLAKFDEVYAQYQSTCDKNNQVDFSEILLRTVELLENNVEVKDYIQNKFKQILVDEFQDTNSIQYKFLKLISSPAANVLVVGDDDQSIYGWRGAVVANMHNFRNDFENVELIQLRRNYRSTNAILGAANSLIKNNTYRIVDKELITDKTTNNKVTIVQSQDEFKQDEFVVRAISSYLKNGFNGQDIAVLYRTNNQSRLLESKLRNKGISYSVYGGLRFYDRKEIKDLIAYLFLIHDHNNNLAFERIVNVPARKIGNATLEKIRVISTETGLSYYDSLEQLLSHSKSKPLSNFYNLIEDLKKKLTEVSNLTEYAQIVAEESGLLNFYEIEDQKEGNSEKGQSRVENIKELFASFSEQEIVRNEQYFAEENDGIDNSNLAEMNISEQLSCFLDNVNLGVAEDSTSDSIDNVRLMTIHSAKGLEFKVVFVIGFEKNLLPLSRGVSFKIDFDKERQEEEEERRLAYVAITRAKEDLFLCYAESRDTFISGMRTFVKTGRSKFINELDRKFIEIKVSRF